MPSLYGADLLEHRINQERGEAGRGLVEEQHRGLGHQRARHRHHLALAAGHRVDLLAAALGESGKEGVHCVKAAIERSVRSGSQAHLQIFRNRKTGKNILPLRHVADAAPRDNAGTQAGDGLSGEHDPSRLGRDQAEDRFHQRRLARAVGSDDSDDLSRREGDRYALEDVDLRGIAGDEIRNRKR